jgi:hypothetical protein
MAGPDQEDIRKMRKGYINRKLFEKFMILDGGSHIMFHKEGVHGVLMHGNQLFRILNFLWQHMFEHYRTLTEIIF